MPQSEEPLDLPDGVQSTRRHSDTGKFREENRVRVLWAEARMGGLALLAGGFILACYNLYMLTLVEPPPFGNPAAVRNVRGEADRQEILFAVGLASMALGGGVSVLSTSMGLRTKVAHLGVPKGLAREFVERELGPADLYEATGDAQFLTWHSRLYGLTLEFRDDICLGMVREYDRMRSLGL